MTLDMQIDAWHTELEWRETCFISCVFSDCLCNVPSNDTIFMNDFDEKSLSLNIKTIVMA